ncbi:MAG: hypothetical protein AB3N14_05360 [Flavobacteriaceae bacterium]
MDTTFKKYWADLRDEAIGTWERLSSADMDEIDGDMGKLEDLLRKKYGHSQWEANRQLVQLVERYDNLSFIEQCSRIRSRMVLHWDDLGETEARRIKCSRLRLMAFLEDHFGISSELSQKETKRFLQQFLD